MRKERIYQSRLHVVTTLFFVIAPFVFLLLFSKFAKIATGELLADVAISFWRLAVAYVIAVAIGWTLAASFYKGKRAIIALPFFDVLQSLPTFAALPLATLIWGPSNFTVIFFLTLAVVWPIFFSLISSLKLIRRDWEEAVKMTGLRGFSYLKNFLWPVSIPALVTGSIVGLGDGWEALVATEIIVRVKSGVGQFFQLFAHNTTITAFGILGFLMLIFTINKLLWLPLLEWSHRRMEE